MIDKDDHETTEGDTRQSQAEGDVGRSRATSGDVSSRRVESIGEIWRVDDEWWRQPVSRRYIEVILEGGAHIMLFEDLATGHWFEQRI